MEQRARLIWAGAGVLGIRREDETKDLLRKGGLFFLNGLFVVRRKVECKGSRAALAGKAKGRTGTRCSMRLDP